jgi:hypothetical protein
MKWMLVVIGIFNGGPEVSNEGLYDSMTDCFLSREQIIWDLFNNADGYPPPNFQVVCIPTDKYL